MLFCPYLGVSSVGADFDHLFRIVLGVINILGYVVKEQDKTTASGTSTTFFFPGQATEATTWDSGTTQTSNKARQLWDTSE
jgi:hypothetical protein